jgi:pyruvate formate lyase activating enzyme
LGITGRIHSFETFGTLDGPGIRFVIFMQGCPLRCIYCHNRDTWEPQGGREYTVDEVMKEISKYTSYMAYSGGGITVSGGEPLLQCSFVAALFKRCHEIGIHTVLDTSGFTDLGNLCGLLSDTSLVLLDIKHASDEPHKIITGAGREKTAGFARLLSDMNIPVWIRYVLVPGYTDSEKDLLAATDFIKSLRNVQKIEVLPYHSMGSFKWEELGFSYPLKGVPSPSEQSIEKARRLLTE